MRNFVGRVTKVRLWGRALSNTEVRWVNDGEWHHVSLDDGLLYVDGKRVKKNGADTN